MPDDDEDMVIDILLADFIHAFVLPRISASGHLLKAPRKAMAKVCTSTLAARVGKDILAKPKGSIAYHVCVAACTERPSTSSLIEEIKTSKMNGPATKPVYLHGAVQFHHADNTIRLSEATGSIAHLPKKKLNDIKNTPVDVQQVMFRYSSDNATFSDWKAMSLIDHDVQCLESLGRSEEAHMTKIKPKSRQKVAKKADLVEQITVTQSLSNRSAAEKSAAPAQNKPSKNKSKLTTAAPSSTSRENIGLFEESDGYGPILRLPGLTFLPEEVPYEFLEALEDAGEVIPKYFQTISKPPSDLEALVERLAPPEVNVSPVEYAASNGNEDPSQALSDLQNPKLDAARNEILSDAIEKYMKQTQTPPVVEQNRRAVIKKLQNDINDAWKGRHLRIEAFGSCANTLHTADSDLDLCIIDPSDGIGKRRDRAFYEPRILASVLRKYGYVKVVAIPHALVPIVKLQDPVHHFSIDINAAHTVGIHNSLLINTYCELDHRVRPFMFALKRWAKARGLNDPTGSKGPITMNSYTIAMLGIFYLQVIGILPRLQAQDVLHAQGVAPLRAIHHGLRVDEMLDVTFFRRATRKWWNTKTVDRIDLPSTHASVLLRFFQFYAAFDPFKHYVSIRSGTVLERHEQMPNIWKDKILVVQDPFIVDKNTAGGMATSTAKLIFPSEFVRGVKILLTSADPLAHLCENQVLPKAPKRREPQKSKPKEQPEPVPVIARNGTDHIVDAKAGGDAAAVDGQGLPEIVSVNDVLNVEPTDMAAVGDNAEVTRVLLEKLKIEHSKLEAS